MVALVGYQDFDEDRFRCIVRKKCVLRERDGGLLIRDEIGIIESCIANEPFYTH
jgi:hypothetical protein